MKGVSYQRGQKNGAPIKDKNMLHVLSQNISGLIREVITKMGDNFTVSYAKGESTEYRLKYRTIPDLLSYHAKERPKEVAYVFTSTEAVRQTFTWKYVHEESKRVAQSLIRMGIRRNEIVAISFRACPDWLFVNFGIILAGAIPIGVSFTYTDGSDVIALLQRLETCSAIFLDPGQDNATWNIFRKIIDTFDKDGTMESRQMPSLKHLISLYKPEQVSDILSLDEFKAMARGDTQLPRVGEDDLVVLFQTSGSTGVPKVLAHTHRSLSQWGHYFDFLGLTSKEILYNDRPFNWLGGYPTNVYTGETRVTRSGMCKTPESPSEFVFNVIIQERCTVFGTLPSFINELMQKELPEDWPVDTINTGGQPIAKHFANCIEKGVTKNLNVIYVSSEANLNLYNHVSRSMDFTEYACGVPFPGVEVKIVGEDGGIVAPYTRGEIYIRSDGMFKCYYNDQEKTKAVLAEDGWYKTDDLGFMTEKGIFYVEGRKSDMIISGGFNVAPAILETVLKRSPGVADALVVPIPHETLYQVVCACFIPKPESDMNGDKLQKYCEDFHADKPRLFTVLPSCYLGFESFPVTSTGKPSRKLLAAEAVSRIKELDK